MMRKLYGESPSRVRGVASCHKAVRGRCEFDGRMERFWEQCCIVPPAYLRRVPHERSNLVQALSLHCQLAAEGVPADQAGPR
jgi:hypothetical protein